MINITSTLNGGSPLTNQSRDDLSIGVTVSLSESSGFTTYHWELLSVPVDENGVPSNVVLSSTNTNTTSFVPNKEGAYLVKLTVDLGEPTEEAAFYRYRVLTDFAKLPLSAAGERKEPGLSIPNDIGPRGWTDDYTHTTLRLMRLLSRTTPSGNILFVDSRQGYSLPSASFDGNSHGDFGTIQEAITFAESQGEPYIIYVRPGTYVEDLNLESNEVTLIGQDVTVQGYVYIDNPGHVPVTISGFDILYFVQVVEGTFHLRDCNVGGYLQINDSADKVTLTNCNIEGQFTISSANTTFKIENCRFANEFFIYSPDMVVSIKDSLFVDSFRSAAQSLTIVGSTFESVFHIDTFGMSAMVSEVTVRIMSSEIINLIFDSLVAIDYTNLYVGASQVRFFTFPNGTPTIYEATVSSKTIHYNGGNSSLSAENVQDAIDEIAAFGASDISFDKTGTGLNAVDVQGALVELDSRPSGGGDAVDVGYENTTSGLTAENVQDAIDEIATSTVLAGDVSFENFGTTILSDNVQGALIELDSRGGGGGAAVDVSFDKHVEGELDAENVQEALDEISTREAEDWKYDNTKAPINDRLSANNIQAAIDELAQRKGFLGFEHTPEDSLAARVALPSMASLFLQLEKDS